MKQLNDKKTFLLWKLGVPCVCLFWEGEEGEIIKINFNFMSHLEAVMFYKCLRKWKIAVGKEHIRMINRPNGRFVTQICSLNDLADERWLRRTAPKMYSPPSNFHDNQKAKFCLLTKNIDCQLRREEKFQRLERNSWGKFCFR